MDTFENRIKKELKYIIFLVSFVPSTIIPFFLVTEKFDITRGTRKV